MAKSFYSEPIDQDHSREAYDATVSWLQVNGRGAALNAAVEDGYDKHINWGQMLRNWQSPPRYGHPLFNVIVEEIKKLHEEKNRQYASGDDPLGNFRRTGQIIAKLLKPGINPSLASCLAFMSKQVDGVYELFGESKENTIDSLEDKLLDITIYSIIGMIMVRESRTKSNTDPESR